VKKLEIIYKSGAKTTLTNTNVRFTDRLVEGYLREYCSPVEKVKSAIFYTYPLKSNEPLVLIENGKFKNEVD